MPDRHPERPEPPAPDPPTQDESGYSEEEEAEVRKRLEDLGYVE